MTASGRSPVSGLSLRRRSLLLGGLSGAAATLATLGHSGSAAAQPPQLPEFDFDTDNALNFMFAPDENAGQGASQFVNPADGTMFIWLDQLIVVTWFDALAPYHPTAVGVHTRLGRRPSSESATNRNMNIALFHASYQATKAAIAPEEAQLLAQVLTMLGLDPDDESEDPTSPVGIGNLAGKGVVAAHLRDGMNFLGDEGGRRYHLRPFADYTGYQPVNTAYELVNPSRWQPQLTPHRRRLGAGAGDKGIFTVQHFATPQMALVRPYSYEHPDQFPLAPPEFSDHRRRKAYRRSVDEVLAASAALTDERKVIAEFFNDKLLGMDHSPVAKIRQHHPELGVQDWAQLFLARSTAVFDALIAVWHQKARYDAVRPVSAIRHVYGSRPVTAWGGVGMGTVDDIPADEWTSYLNPEDHPEYPSDAAAMCSAAAQAARRYFGDDALDWRFAVPAGWTKVEPGITPASDLELHWPTWTDHLRGCADSLVWGGVHFPKTVERSVEFGEQFGDLAYEFAQRHINGDID